MSPARRGLSLIELLIVLSLIATMMALSLPMLSTANAKARSELCQQNLVEISQAIAGFTQDTNALPTLHPLQPTQQGLSLPEFIEPRLHTPHVLLCPSDETEQSHLFGTSYQWSSRFNGLHPGELGGLLGQPLIRDRESFHAGSARPANEVTLIDDENGRRLTVPGFVESPGHSVSSYLYLNHQTRSQGDGPGNGQGHAYGHGHGLGQSNGNAFGHNNGQAPPHANPHRP